MKRKAKQWWSTISPIYIKKNKKPNSHLSHKKTLNTTKQQQQQTPHMSLEI
jgi:CRISPR/Cas system endoribonuclease Cas6 (RAMP superfamily)